jgi:hypothetical protein
MGRSICELEGASGLLIYFLWRFNDSILYIEFSYFIAKIIRRECNASIIFNV